MPKTQTTAQPKLHYGPVTWHDGAPRTIADTDIASETERHTNAGIEYITAHYPSGRVATWPAPGSGTGHDWFVACGAA